MNPALSNPQQFFDSHAHLHLAKVSPEVLIQRSKEAGVSALIQVSTNLKDSLTSVQLKNKHNNFIFPSAGFYPDQAEDFSDEKIHNLEAFIHAYKEDIVAVGECGIDFHWNYATPELQTALFSAQVKLADKLKLPLIVHTRNSIDAVYDVLNKLRPSSAGVMHCFSGDETYVPQFIDLGFYISFAGNVTYKNSKDLQRACAAVPMDKLLIETDTPYLAPVPKRGNPNEPSFIPFTAAFIADLRGISTDELAEKTFENTKTLFKIEKTCS